jgi:hypothetical protein
MITPCSTTFRKDSWRTGVRFPRTTAFDAELTKDRTRQASSTPEEYPPEAGVGNPPLVAGISASKHLYGMEIQAYCSMIVYTMILI